MSPEQFILMMNELPDDMIDAANRPFIRHKRHLRLVIPTIAACFIVLIAAAVYPKLRMQTPLIIEPPVYTETATVTTAITTIVTETIISTETQTVAPQTSTTAGSVSVTVRTTVTETETDTVTELQMTESLIEEEKTEQTASETTVPEETMPDSIQVPICRTEAVVVIETNPCEEWDEEGDEEDTVTHIECHFFEPTEADIVDFETLPENINRSDYKFICVSISKCENAAITGGSITDGQCILNIVWLHEEDSDAELRVVKYLLAFPAAYNISAKDMQAAFTAISDRSLFQGQMEAASEYITIQS